VREIPLRQTTDIKKKNKKEDDDVEVTASPGMREQIVSFAFEPRTRGKFDFHIDDRVLVAGHDGYRMSFKPKSSVDDLPEGRVWVDTNDFVIAREEFWYRDRSPAPLWLKRLDSCVVERTKIDGQWWVVSRILARVQLTSMVRLMCKLAKEPIGETVDFVATRTTGRSTRGSTTRCSRPRRRSESAPRSCLRAVPGFAGARPGRAARLARPVLEGPRRLDGHFLRRA
jgi:hypothetical protein